METLLGTTLPVFIGLNVVLFGGSAIMTGRALAATWRPIWLAVPYCMLLGLGCRFLTFALFEGELLSIPGYVISSLVLLLLCLLANRLTAVALMVRQYPWLYERAGPFSWRQRSGNSGGGNG